MLNRRHVLSLPLLGLAGCSSTHTQSHSSASKNVHPTNHPSLAKPSPYDENIIQRGTNYKKIDIPRYPITDIPAQGKHVAITVDDGVNSKDVETYAKVASKTGMRLTFFANGTYDSWTENKTLLAPLLESGQIAIGNHTWDHPNISGLSNSELVWQITKNEKHFKNLFGITLAPFFRPPYGAYNSENLKVLHDHGYKAVVMWYGTLGDDQLISVKHAEADASQYVLPGKIVIGHANHPVTASTTQHLADLIHKRNLQTVTLHDVFKF